MAGQEGWSQVRARGRASRVLLPAPAPPTAPFHLLIARSGEFSVSHRGSLHRDRWGRPEGISKGAAAGGATTPPPSPPTPPPLTTAAMLPRPIRYRR